MTRGPDTNNYRRGGVFPDAVCISVCRANGAVVQGNGVGWRRLLQGTFVGTLRLSPREMDQDQNQRNKREEANVLKSVR
ncbi:hypothetical protein ACSQ67_010258 [Phaseolus vulgaris]